MLPSHLGVSTDTLGHWNTNTTQTLASQPHYHAHTHTQIPNHPVFTPVPLSLTPSPFINRSSVSRRAQGTICSVLINGTVGNRSFICSSEIMQNLKWDALCTFELKKGRFTFSLLPTFPIYAHGLEDWLCSQRDTTTLVSHECKFASVPPPLCLISVMCRGSGGALGSLWKKKIPWKDDEQTPSRCSWPHNTILE